MAALILIGVLASDRPAFATSQAPLPAPSHPIRTKSAEAQKFFDQGLAYVYAFNHEEAVRSFKRAAELDPSLAMARWGVALLEGNTVEANPVEGESSLRRAALEGDAEAAAVIGDLYARGGKLPPNYAEAAIWFRRAAEAKHKGAARALGMLHLTGAGVPRDQEEAARWFRIAAEAGDQNARIELANLLLHGEGDQQDSLRTREWFEHLRDELCAALEAVGAKPGDRILMAAFGAGYTAGAAVIEWTADPTRAFLAPGSQTRPSGHASRSGLSIVTPP